MKGATEMQRVTNETVEATAPAREQFYDMVGGHGMRSDAYTLHIYCKSLYIVHHSVNNVARVTDYNPFLLCLVY